MVSGASLRQEFEDLIRRDLLGPAADEEEIITEQSVRNRYLLGMLAPLNIKEPDEEPLDELADDTEDNAEEGTAEPSTPAPKRNATPSALGLSFCLGLQETEFHVQARWGQYLREQDGEGSSVWKRHPRGGSRTFPLTEGNLPAWAPDTEVPNVVVRSRVRRRDDHWSVTLFLSNEQEENRPREVYWLFQAELEVSGRFAQRPSQRHVSTLDAASRLEDSTNEMLPARAAEAGAGGSTLQNFVQAALQQRITDWRDRAQRMRGGARLGYRDGRDGVTVGLLETPGAAAWTEFTVLNSLRDVEPEAALTFNDSGMDSEEAGE